MDMHKRFVSIEKSNEVVNKHEYLLKEMNNALSKERRCQFCFDK